MARALLSQIPMEDVKKAAMPKKRAAKRLLLVDDEEAILKPMAKYFREIGCTVVLAREPEEAERALACETFDALILDLRLTPQGWGGLDVLRTLKDGGSSLAVVVMSAYASHEVEAEALRLGAHSILRKPQPLANVARTVFELLGEK